MNLFNRSVNKTIINVNGHKMEIDANGNITISNGNVTINGIKTDTYNGDVVEVSIQGNVNNLSCSGSVTVNGSCGSIDCGGNCTVDGKVIGDIDCGGNCNCGDVSGGIDAGGNVICGRR